jgi:hypothetical protein
MGLSSSCKAQSSRARYQDCQSDAKFLYDFSRRVAVSCRCLGFDVGRTIDHVVSRRLHTAAALVPSQLRPCGIYGRQSGSGTNLLRVLQLPLTVLIPPNASYSSPGTSTTGQLETDLPSGFCLTTPQENNKNKAYNRSWSPHCSDSSD